MSKKKKLDEAAIKVPMSFYEMDVIMTALMTRLQHLINLDEPTHPSVGAQIACLEVMHDRLNSAMNALEAREALPGVMEGIEELLRGAE